MLFKQDRKVLGQKSIQPDVYFDEPPALPQGAECPYILAARALKTEHQPEI